jgi:regulator of sigma E protease
MLWIILGIVLFLFLVLIHELGHFIAAKKTGVQVLEFGMGIPPKIATLWTDKSGTEYTLNAIPLGGFVRLKGEDPTHPETFLAKDSFIMASFVSKTIILLAWVTVNFLFARGVLTMLFRRGISPLMIVPENASTMNIQSYLTPTTSFLVEKWYITRPSALVEVKNVLSGWIGSTMWLFSWDIIVSLNEMSVDSFNFKKQLKNSIGKDIILLIKRWSENLSLTWTCPDTNCLLWVALNDISVKDLSFTYKFWFFTAAKVALQELMTQGKMILSKIWDLWASFFSWSANTVKKELNSLSGPVGAIKPISEVIKAGLRVHFLVFWAMISLALAVFNVLPIPALDGGRWLWVVIQSVFFPKKIEKYFTIESYINFVCFVLLMGLGIYIILKDLVTAWGVNIPFIG